MYAYDSGSCGLLLCLGLCLGFFVLFQCCSWEIIPVFVYCKDRKFVISSKCLKGGDYCKKKKKKKANFDLKMHSYLILTILYMELEQRCKLECKYYV